MSKVKTVIFFVALVLAGILVFQNQEFFTEKNSLSMDLFMVKFTSAPTPNIFLFFICVAAGFVAAWLSTLSYRMKTNKTIKQLRDESEKRGYRIAELEQRLKGMHRSAPMTPESERPGPKAGPTVSPASAPRQVVAKPIPVKPALNNPAVSDKRV